MIDPIDFSTAKLIVQFGPGTGSFTKELLVRRQEKTTIVLIEFNAVFCETLRQKYGHEKNIYIHNGTAEDVDGILRYYGLSPQVDYIVSGLPFASLPSKQSQAILDRARAVLRPNGVFVTFQYTLLKKGLFINHFDTVAIIREWKNIPPAYVLACTVSK